MKVPTLALIAMALLATTKSALAIQAVPDTASTSYLLGAGFVGLACLRAWHSRKR